MIFQQCELPLFAMSRNTRTVPSPRRALRRDCESVRYWTTDQVVKLLKLNSPYPLRKAKAHDSAYRSDRYVVVAAGRNRWELFKRCTT